MLSNKSDHISCGVEEVERLVCCNDYSSSSGDILENSFQPPEHIFPKREFGQTSKVTDHFKVPGLADGNGYTVMPLMVSLLPFVY